MAKMLWFLYVSLLVMIGMVRGMMEVDGRVEEREE